MSAKICIAIIASAGAAHGIVTAYFFHHKHHGEALRILNMIWDMTAFVGLYCLFSMVFSTFLKP